MSLLYSYVGKYRKILFFALFLAAVNQIFSLLDPQIFRLVIDGYATKAAELSSHNFIFGVAGLLLLAMGAAFVSRVAKNFQDYYVNVITQRVGAEMYAHSVAHSLVLEYGVFEDQRSGQLLQILQRARSDSQKFITNAISIAFFSVVGIIFVLVYAFLVHWSIGLAYFLIIPVLGVTTVFLSRKIKEAQTAIIAETADLAGSTTETIRNVELVKSLGLEEQETKRLNDVNDRILQLELKKVRIIRKFSFLQGTLINAMRTIIIFLMFILIFRGTVTLGQFFTLLFYSFFLFNPLASFGDVATSYQEARGSMESLGKILAISPAKVPKNPKQAGKITNIRFAKVAFSYAGADLAAVENIDFSAQRGQSIAFVGPSGSGKTTLIKLIVGLYRPDKGKITVNGEDSSVLDYAAIRHRIGYVSQETQLFAGTIRENLLFVSPVATDAECVEALRGAAALPIIERGGYGLDTKIGEGGIKISGGERQRLAIARALLRKPDLIIFDEATSSLDSITERAITETMRAVSQGSEDRIVVMVAHRLSTIMHADAIYVLQKGAIVEKGTHKELLKKDGLYAALWKEQGGGG